MKKKIILASIFMVIILAAVFVFGCRNGTNKKIEIINYDNGLRAVLNRDAKAKTVSIMVSVRVGAIDEKQPNQSGLSHFLEHMMFKGSRDYPEGLFAAIEKFGGEMNAYTSKQITSYYIDGPKENLEEMIIMLADAMENPIFPQDTFETERNVIIEELNLRRDLPEFKLGELLDSNLYKGGVMSNNVGGNINTISKVTRDDLFDYYRKHYIPSNMAVSIAGNFSRTKVKQILKNSFGKFDKKTPLDMPNLEIQDFNSANIIVRDNVSANFGALAFLGPDSSSDDIIKGSLAANVLYMYITRALKVKSDILNSIDVSFDTYLGPGAFYISYSYNPSYAKEVDEEIIRQLDNMLRGDILPIDIDRAKTHIKTALSFRRETQNAIASNAALWLLLGRKEFVNSDTYFQKIDALDVSDIKEFFNKYYSQDKTVKIAIQPRSSK